MRKFIETLQARREASKNEGGFSLIDVVITVAIIVALSVGGFVTYNGIVDNAKNAAVGAAADQVYTAAVIAENDGGFTLAEVQSNYNDSSSGIAVEITGTGATLKVEAGTDADNDGVIDTDPAAKFTASRGAA